MWGFILGRSRWFLVLAALSCGVLAPLLLGWAFPRDPALVFLVGASLAISAIVVALRSELFDPGKLVMAREGDQAGVLAVTGAGLVSLVAVGLFIALALVIVAIVLVVLFGAASSGD